MDYVGKTEINITTRILNNRRIKFLQASSSKQYRNDKQGHEYSWRTTPTGGSMLLDFSTPLWNSFPARLLNLCLLYWAIIIIPWINPWMHLKPSNSFNIGRFIIKPEATVKTSVPDEESRCSSPWLFINGAARRVRETWLSVSDTEICRGRLTLR